MRLWSVHPKHLDAKGLVALWREGLLAKKVLEGKTKGYKNHPQLIRFKKSSDPLKAINIFLGHVLEEAQRRNYNFDGSKIKNYKDQIYIWVHSEQLEYEWQHLQKKLKIRDNQKHKENSGIKKVLVNKIFKKKKGKVEYWEIT